MLFSTPQLLAPIPEPQAEMPDDEDPSPTGRRILAPPPLKVLLESDEPTGDDILMLTEEEANVARQHMHDIRVRASWTDLQSGKDGPVGAPAPEAAAVLAFQNDDELEDSDDPCILPNYANSNEARDGVDPSSEQNAPQ